MYGSNSGNDVVASRVGGRWLRGVKVLGDRGSTILGS